MELEHEFTVAAPVEAAWEVLLDLERIAPCMPGATLTSHEGDEFAGTVRVKLGPVTMSFAGNGRFVERDADARAVVVEASGKDRRGGGTARATIRARLRADGERTAVAVHTDLVVTGRAAQFGRGMIADVSTRLLGQFTGCLAGQLGQPDALRQPDAAAAAAPAAAPREVAERTAAGAGFATSVTSAAPADTDTDAAAATPTSKPAEPIDLLGVTGVRAAVGRLLPYVIVFVVGVIIGGAAVALLTG